MRAARGELAGPRGLLRGPEGRLTRVIMTRNETLIFYPIRFTAVALNHRMRAGSGKVRERGDACRRIATH